jgi:integrase/recombinase XerD
MTTETTVNGIDGAAMLASFERHLSAEGKRDQTIAHYVGASRQFLDYCTAEGLPDLENISREHVEMWLVSLRERGYAKHSIKNRFVGLRVFLKWLFAEDEIAKDPTARIRMPAVDEVQKDIVSPEDMKRVFDHLRKAKKHRDAALIAVIYDTGLRTTEIADCELADVDFKTGLIFIPTTKSHRVRTVRLSPVTLEMLDRYHRRMPQNRRYLFEGARGKLTRAGVYDIVRKAFEGIDYPKTIGAHDLRHSSATAAALSGELDESEAMQLYGWHDSSMWRHYSATARTEAALKAHVKASPMSRLQGTK